jgi:hypothetical protein
MIEERKQGDDEAVQGVLRAKDIIPGEALHRSETPDAGEIPRFNLADDIMAEHRKITAIRRKGPDAKGDMVPEEAPAAVRNHTVQDAGVERDEIIAEIVARDIEQLCRAQ